MSDHTCHRCPHCDSCPACAADALDREVVEVERLQLALDTIEGVATGQPGEAPATAQDGWTTALAAVLAVVAERDRLRERLEAISSQSTHALAMVMPKP